MKIITQNKKVYHDYEVLDTIEAGIVLTGDEVKSLRAGHVNLVGSFATMHQGELFMINCQITPYAMAYQKKEADAKRSRKLLLHRKEITRMSNEIAQKGVTIVPIKLYFNEKSKVKVELGICKHKKAADRKKEIKEKDIKRETQRELKKVYRY
jgi:SsrA-binding protein